MSRAASNGQAPTATARGPSGRPQTGQAYRPVGVALVFPEQGDPGSCRPASTEGRRRRGGNGGGVVVEVSEGWIPRPTTGHCAARGSRRQEQAGDPAATGERSGATRPRVGRPSASTVTLPTRQSQRREPAVTGCRPLRGPNLSIRPLVPSPGGEGTNGASLSWPGCPAGPVWRRQPGTLPQDMTKSPQPAGARAGEVFIDRG